MVFHTQPLYLYKSVLIIYKYRARPCKLFLEPFRGKWFPSNPWQEQHQADLKTLEESQVSMSASHPLRSFPWFQGENI